MNATTTTTTNDDTKLYNIIVQIIHICTAATATTPAPPDEKDNHRGLTATEIMNIFFSQVPLKYLEDYTFLQFIHKDIVSRDTYAGVAEKEIAKFRNVRFAFTDTKLYRSTEKFLTKKLEHFAHEKNDKKCRQYNENFSIYKDGADKKAAKSTTTYKIKKRFLLFQDHCQKSSSGSESGKRKAPLPSPAPAHEAQSKKPRKKKKDKEEEEPKNCMSSLFDKIGARADHQRSDGNHNDNGEEVSPAEQKEFDDLLLLDDYHWTSELSPRAVEKTDTTKNSFFDKSYCLCGGSACC